MPVVVGYVDSPEGRGALRAAVHEARARDGRVVVVMSAPRGLLASTVPFGEMKETVPLPSPCGNTSLAPRRTVCVPLLVFSRIVLPA